MSSTKPSSKRQKPTLRRRKARAPGAGLIAWTRLVQFRERLWPNLLSALGVCALFGLFSLFGIWQYMHWAIHYSLLVIFVFAFVFLLVRDLKDLTWPTRRDALQRLEEDGRVAHAPLQSLDDTPFEADETSPLWKLHRLRMMEAARGARLGPARATADMRDPWHLRYAVFLLLVLGCVISGRETPARFIAAFSPTAGESGSITVDMWVDPPDYTGKAPIVLAQGRIQSIVEVKGSINVPVGATLHTRITGAPKFGPGKASLVMLTEQGRAGIELERQDKTISGVTALNENNALTLKVGGKTLNWPIAIRADRAPTAALNGDIEITDQNQLRFTVAISDDYGLVEGRVLLRLNPDQERPLDAPALLSNAFEETVDITLNALTGARGPRLVEVDLTDHPWAGLSVLLRVKVMDGAGQSAETLSQIVTLPERDFYNPLAQAIIHERRNLAVAPQSWQRTGLALEALTLTPEEFYTQPTDYLLMRAAFWDVQENQGQDVNETVSEFWPLALQLEDQALELARRALEAAQLALREALERGASPEEIARLIEELRAAMQTYVEALANSGQEFSSSGDSQQLESQDLDAMLDNINELSESGANNAARQLLSELENMLRNLQIAEGGDGQSSSGSGKGGQGASQGSGQAGGQGSGQAGGQGGQQGGAGSAIEEAGDLIGQQRSVTDDTFKSARDRADGNAPQKSGETLAQEQGDIADGVQKLLDQLEGQKGQGGQSTGGASSGDQLSNVAKDAYQDALRQMKQAQEALQSGNLSGAGIAQADAMRSLRSGADALAAAEVARNGDGQNGQGEGDGTGDGTGERAADGTAPGQLDPLGRPYGGGEGQDIGIPDLSDPEKARELIIELRRRLSVPGKSKEEIEYLERLLDRF